MRMNSETYMLWEFMMMPLFTNNCRGETLNTASLKNQKNSNKSESQLQVH